MITLTKDSIGKTFIDSSGNEYICHKHIQPCCSIPYYLLLDLQSPSEYPYTSNGVRLDFKLKPVIDTSTSLIKEKI